MLMPRDAAESEKEAKQWPPYWLFQSRKAAGSAGTARSWHAYPDPNQLSRNPSE
jgi:hypothetical protein